MQGKDLYEYAVIRIVPCPEREEFLNTGVILYCPAQRFLNVKYQLNRERIASFCKRTNVDNLQCYLDSFATICLGEKKSGIIAAQPMAYRFRWITANRSTIVQTSKVHPGFCNNAAEELDKIFEQMVL